MDGLVSYLRTAAEIKSLVALGFKKVIELLKLKKVRVRLQPLMQLLLLEKKKDKKYLDKIRDRIDAWQRERDLQNLNSTVLLYHNGGAKALHGFRYQVMNYEKKERAIYKNERKSFSSKERIQWIKYISKSNTKELLDAGLTDKDIQSMQATGRSPTGYDVHHRVPLDDGGGNDFKNFILLRNDVEHRSVHGYYNPGELRVKLLAVNDSVNVALPIPPVDAVVYPNPSRGYYCQEIPNSQLVDLYDVD